MRGGSPSHRGQAGFTLLELSVSLALLLLGLAIAAQLLMETSQLFAETTGESLDTPVPLVIARMRADVQGAAAVFPILDDDGSLLQIAIAGVAGRITYGRAAGDLYRSVESDAGSPGKPALLWRGVTGWSCRRIGPKGLIDLTVTYRRRTVPRTPLPALPAIRGPRNENLTQRIFLLPRGAGLGETW